MTLPEKVRAVEELFIRLDKDIASFQEWSGLHCVTGCGKCCFKPDIVATILEFIPFAHYLYKHSLAESWYTQLQSTQDTICLILNPTQSGVGLCSEYMHRGLICRLFGFSARTNKYSKRELVTCQVIKTEFCESYSHTVNELENPQKAIPLMSQYHMQLISIDEDLARKHYPINEAIKKALEVVLSYYAYRNEENDT